MSYETPDENEVLQAVAKKIRHSFLGVSLEWVAGYVNEGPILDVLVSEKEHLKEIKGYCKWLQKHPLEPRVPVKITVKAA